MGHFIQRQTRDHHTLDVYVTEPSTPTKAGLIIIQEAFGVNHHIQSVCDLYAKEGYQVAAPALYDRLERNVQLGYVSADFQKGIGLMNQLDFSKIFLDIEAAMDFLKSTGVQKIGMMGFCFGGTVTWRSAHHFKLDAAVCYYGGSIARYANEKPQAPVLLHFGEKDSYISPEDVQKIITQNPEVEAHLYPVDHGFNC
ncbi:MAG: dienelactone hydrolase family protein, partial [Candidatus Nucleicultricaceae bacterium]